jgi:hypothetical protein
MNPTEAATNIVTALINNKFITTPETASKAYKIIFETIVKPS